MSDETEENTTSNAENSVDNSNNSISGPATHNTYITNNYFTLPSRKEKKKLKKKRQSINIRINDLTITKEPEDVNMKIIPIVKVELTIGEKEKLILNLVWKHLSKNDKLICTLVSKRFNNLISEMDCFYLNINLWIKPINSIPILTRDYTQVYLGFYEFYHLDPHLHQTLKHLSRSSVDILMDNCKTNLMTLCDLLDELPMLDKLELENVTIREAELSLKDLPKFLHLKDLRLHKMDDVENLFPIFSSAPCIQRIIFYLSMAKLSVIELNAFLIQHKNSLKILKIESYSIYNDLTDCNWDFNIDCLLQLRDLTLFRCDEIITKVLTSKCVDSLTDLIISYRFNNFQKLNSFLRNYFMEKKINEDHLLKYEAEGFKNPIITRTKCPNSGNFNTTFYLVHYCIDNNQSFHSKCKSIPLTNLKSNLIEFEDNECNLIIHIRDNMKDFEIERKNLLGS